MKKILFICTCAWLFGVNNAQAQTVNSNLTQVDSSLLYITGEGTFLNLGKATKINFFTTIQTGLNFSKFDTTNKNIFSNRLSLNLARFALNVSALKDKVTVGIVTDFTSTMPILEGWIGFSVLNKRGKIIMGQRQTHTNNRLAMADERYAQTMAQTIAGISNDGSMFGGLMQNFVGATREGGLFFETNFNLKKWRIYPSVSITTGEGQNFFNTEPNIGLKYGGRLDILPMGDFIKNNAFIAHDLYRERKPKLAIGVAGSFNAKVSSPMGSANGIIKGIFNKSGVTDYANYRKIVADFIFKHQGFAIVGEYTNGSVSGSELYTNTAGTNKLTTELASNFYNMGTAVNIQSSYVFKSGWAIDGRFSTITPEFNTETSLVHNQKWYSVGINKYLKNNALKIGINTTHINEQTPTIKTERWLTNLALQIIL